MSAGIYPEHLITEYVTHDGQHVSLRPIKASDAAMVQDFVRKLSVESRHLRFQDTLLELNPIELKRLTEIDYKSMMAIIAVIVENGVEREIGAARYAADYDAPHACEFAVVVTDAWHDKGIAGALMQHLINIATHEGFVIMYGDILHHNSTMLGFAEKLGFHISPHPDDSGLRRAILALTDSDTLKNCNKVG